MYNSYRIRTKPGVDSSIKVLIDQEFEYLEILSLKILPSQIYTRQCSDYGVIVGRISVNNGFGIPNAKVSVFVPLDSVDELDPVISELYPYKTLSDLNEDGYRYNLLPYQRQHSGHNPTGTFFTREDVLTNPTLIEVYDKYYRYTAITNDSGDYMIFGVPLGSQTVVVDVDLSDIGEFSLSPQDLIRMGVATESQVAGINFKSSTNLRELPQIININRTIEVQPLWGQPEICELGITRTDFDLSSEANIDITPTAIFMGSLISSNDDDYLKKNCKTKPDAGALCSLVTGPGEILAVRQTINIDSEGRPILETVDLEQGGQVIDENGTWLVDLPMNMNYVITNEFGEKVFSNDPKIGIPTTGKYRFKVKWNQSPSLSADPIKRGYFLVPNIKEYGWEIDGGGNRIDPLTNSSATLDNQTAAQKSYAFSVDWNDYGDTGTTIGLQMIQDGIDCNDRFYEFQYNKVYTVSQLITQYRKGYGNLKIIAIKDILDTQCESENNKFPTNDAVLKFDLIYLLFTIMLFIFRPLLYSFLLVVHILAFTLMLIGPILAILAVVVLAIVWLICQFINGIILAINWLVSLDTITCPNEEDFKSAIDTFLNLYKKFTKLKIPNLSYPDCEFCPCDDGEASEANVDDPNYPGGMSQNYQTLNESGVNAVLTPFELLTSYNVTTPTYLTSDNFVYEILFAGQSLGDGSVSNPYTSKSRVPQPKKFQKNSDSSVGPNEYELTLSLTTSEKLNLFNTKAKYFDSSANNPGGGVNQIKVSFNPSDPYTHTDNVFVLVVQPGNESTFEAGNMISFQNPALSKDPNQTGYTLTNIYGTNSSTGTIVNSPTITVNYVKPDGTTDTVNYTSTQSNNDVSYSKFPMDVEYFQVITATTVLNFSSLSVSNPLSLKDRYVLNSMRFFRTDGYTSSPNYNVLFTGGNEAPILKPSDFYNSIGDHTIVFMVRGVDPYTTRTDCKYDLSKLFGHTAFNNSVVVQSGVNNAPQYHLNQPITGGFKNVQHNLTNSDSNDGYSGMDLFYDSFHYKPDTTGPSPWSSFTSDLQYYYSRLDNNNTSFIPESGKPSVNSGFITNAGYGLKVKSSNNFYKEYDGTVSSNVYTLVASSSGRGYLQNEIVEGGSGFFSDSQLQYFISGSDFIPGYVNYYYAPRYSFPTPLSNMNYNLGGSGRQIIMRSDRLPTSTTVQDNLNNSFPLHTNVNFCVFQISDDGTSVQTGGSGSGQTPTFSGTTADNDGEGEPMIVSSVLNSFNCNSMVPLSCYVQGDTPNEITVAPEGSPCYKDPVGGQVIVKNGCYVFVSTIFLSLPNDFLLLTEWTSRLAITFAACRNVWGHLFTNNWINGTLYAFSLRNDVVFTSPFSDNPNQATFNYCRDVSLIHNQTNNYYYRSSPWDNTLSSFIGKDKASPSSLSSSLFGQYKGNEYNLLYPTTLIDLGPRNDYMDELVLSDGYDGYVVNKMNSTTYTDVSEVLNLFIITRLANTPFLSAILGGANVLTYFSRTNSMVDGDYAQSISVTSELGVAPFEASNYPDLPGQDSIYINGINSTDQVFGVFYNSNIQVRDYISPKRTIIDPSALVTDPCAFNNFPVKSQEVPFYQWNIDQNSYVDNIFGSESNEWYTNPISSNSFFSYKYQSLDRIDPTSRYFRTNGSFQTQDYPGYIYSVSPVTITITASIVGNTMTVTSVSSPQVLQQGFVLSGPGVLVGTTITGQNSVNLPSTSNGGLGVYEVTPSQNVGSTVITVTGFIYDADINTWAQNNPKGRVITVGSPYHFYFGLKRGKTAFDRFFKKWINGENIVD